MTEDLTELQTMTQLWEWLDYQLGIGHRKLHFKTYFYVDESIFHVDDLRNLVLD